jgi:hypothetical protein
LYGISKRQSKLCSYIRVVAAKPALSEVEGLALLNLSSEIIFDKLYKNDILKRSFEIGGGKNEVFIQGFIGNKRCSDGKSSFCREHMGEKGPGHSGHEGKGS